VIGRKKERMNGRQQYDTTKQLKDGKKKQLTCHAQDNQQYQADRIAAVTKADGTQVGTSEVTAPNTAKTGGEKR